MYHSRPSLLLFLALTGASVVSRTSSSRLHIANPIRDQQYGIVCACNLNKFLTLSTQLPFARVQRPELHPRKAIGPPARYLPWVRESLFARVALLYVDAHQSADKVFGGVADVVPVRRVELELTCKNPISVSGPAEEAPPPGRRDSAGRRGERVNLIKFAGPVSPGARLKTTGLRAARRELFSPGLRLTRKKPRGRPQILPAFRCATRMWSARRGFMVKKM